MARGGKRKGAGAKRKYDRREALLVRVDPDLKRQLERQRKARGAKSMSRFVELMLKDSVEALAASGVGFLMGQAAELSAWDEKNNWRSNVNAFEALRLALPQLLDLFKPAEGASTAPHPLFTTPDEHARNIVFTVWNYLDTTDEARAEGLPSKHMLRGYPKAARALGYTDEVWKAPEEKVEKSS